MTATPTRRPTLAWASGLLLLAFPAAAGNMTVAGTATASAPSSIWITVESPFTGDDDRDGYTTYELATSPTGPFTAAPATHIPGTTEWRAVTFYTLSPATTYYVRATWVDPDGVSGTNPQVVPVTTLASAPAAARLLPATVQARDTGIYVGVPVADDSNQNVNWNVYVGLGPSGPWTEKCGDASYRPKRCRIRSLTPGTDYWVRVDMIDPDGVVGANPQVFGPIRYNGARNLALGRPVSSEPGWGCCPNNAQLVDGRIQYDAWYYGFAWRGGLNRYAGAPAGWKQATVDFGVPTTFARAAIWYHDGNSPPIDWKFQWSNDGASWTDLVSVTWPVCRGASQRTDVSRAFPSCAHDASFTPVTARYFRYTFDDRTLFGGLHGWANELEVFDQGATVECIDADGDGYGDPGDSSCPGGPETDCDDTDPNNYPSNTEVCDDQDNNCDGQTDEGFDDDADGYTTCGGDCDDTDGSVYPGATEVCDDIDNNCDGQIDEGFDNDADGYTTCGGDCDDTDGSVYPGATEVCDDIDNNCDGQTDEGFDDDADSYTSCGGDCDDTDGSVYPGAEESLCDGVDQNCNGLADDDVNADGDPVTFCSDDCDDSDAAVYPGAQELLCDGVDQNCNGLADDDVNADGDPVTFCSGDCDDGDANNYPGNVETLCDGRDNDCNDATTDDVNLDGDPVTFCSGDCDDGDANNYPTNTEVCDGQDNDCDGVTDQGLPDFDLDGLCDGVDPDDDNDAVDDGADVCGLTPIPEETVPSVRLGTNRWALTDADNTFDTKKPKGNGPRLSFTTIDTAGCSCEQIIGAQGLGQGHVKFGCSISAMEDWIALINP